MSLDLEDLAVATGLEKVSLRLNPKGGRKECANHRTIAFISYACKVMLKIVHARLQDYVNKNLRMSKLGLEKEEELEIQLPTFTGSYKKKGN